LSVSNGKQPHAEIAGAGFAGLTTAVALRQRGWTVRVHEKGSDFREFGAGLVIWHNGLRVLEEIGALGDVLDSSFAPPVYETRVQNVTVSREAFGGLPWRTLTRQRLYQAILSAARREGVDLVLDSEVVGADPAGTLILASGQRLPADLVVGADGVRSRVRDGAGFSREVEGSRDGITRFLVPRLKDRLGPGEWDNVIDFWNFEPRTLRILYVPCGEQDLYVALMAPRQDADGSRVPIDKALWTEIFPHLEPVLEAASHLPGRYDGYETTVVREWAKGRIALVGDAAHAMCPALAQGVGCAMVNGFALAVTASDGAMGTLDSRLQDWEEAVRPVTDRCQAMSAGFARTRNMSKGSQFTAETLEAARYDPVSGDLAPLGQL
jgi:2-methyl-3-hydroxypyridine 5-carboxylic acid dioxygenase